MKQFEEFMISGYGDLGDPETAHKKLVGNVTEILKALKKENYTYVLSRFDKKSVEYAFAERLQKAQQEASEKSKGRW